MSQFGALLDPEKPFLVLEWPLSLRACIAAEPGLPATGRREKARTGVLRRDLLPDRL